MKWICYDESVAFSIEARDLEHAEKLASAYEAKVLGPCQRKHRHDLRAGSKAGRMPFTTPRK